MSIDSKIAVSYLMPEQKLKASALAHQLALPLVDSGCMDYPLLLIQTADCLQINSIGASVPGPVSVNFLTGKLAHRYQFGGGKGQLIAKAIGLKETKKKLKVLDATAGFGQDGFVLASLGCSVLMLERSNIMAALLQDGLQRGQEAAWFAQLDLQLQCVDAIEYLQTPHDFDVIYIDPMFPVRNQSALVKKEMRVIRQVVGDDLDIEELLKKALLQPVKRVVLKRNRYADTINPERVVGIVSGKSTRYDIYRGACD